MIISHNIEALKILKYLVTWVQNERRTIYYSELTRAVAYPVNPDEGVYYQSMISKTLGVLGHMLEKVQIAENIPFIQSLVINISEGLPGPGYKEFLPGYKSMDEYEKYRLVELEQKKSLVFPNWEEVNDYLQSIQKSKQY